MREHAAVRRLLEPAGIEIEDGELLDRARDSGQRQVARLRGQPSGGGVAAARNWRRSWAISTASTISSCCFRPTRSATCWTRSPANATCCDRDRRRSTASGARPRRELEELERTEQEKLRLLDLWSSSARKSKAPRSQPGEDAALENERRVLQNVRRLQESAGAAYAALYEVPESALALARIAAKRLDELCRIDSIARRRCASI